MYLDVLIIKKDIIADAGMELTDDELEMVAGGRLSAIDPDGNTFDN